MRLPATGCFRHRDRLGHRGSRHRIQRPNQVAGPGNSHGCRHRRRDDWRPEDLWPGDVERPLPLTRRLVTAAEDKEERLRLSGTRIELEELLQLPVDVAYEGLLTDDVSESVRKKLITLRAGPSRTACSNLRNPAGVGADDGARRDVVHQRDIADGTGVEPATHR